jgi:hypothetical protein
MANPNRLISAPEVPVVTLKHKTGCGEDTGTPVSEDYLVPFKFTGTLNRVVVELGESKLSTQDQKELDEQEGANEIID